MIKCNYHTHTSRCKHASGKDEEYVLAAIENGYEVLGFSDHTPWKYDSDFKPGMRMELKEFDDYYQSIKALKTKYSDKIKILIGVEAEYYPQYMKWFKDFIDKYQLDYVIFGNHFYKSDELRKYYGSLTDDDFYLNEYVKYCFEGLKTGIYSYLCHPDLFMRGRHIFDDKAKEASYKICEYAKKHDIILEYNLEGLRACVEGNNVYYPDNNFWEIASKVGNKVIIGVDAHMPTSLKTNKYYDMALKTLNDLGLEIVDEIPLVLKNN